MNISAACEGPIFVCVSKSTEKKDDKKPKLPNVTAVIDMRIFVLITLLYSCLIEYMINILLRHIRIFVVYLDQIDKSFWITQ